MTDFEIKILNWIQEEVSPFIITIFKFLTNLGGEQILILVLLIIYFMISKKGGQRIAFAVFGSLLINNTLKGLFYRIRPFNNPKSTYTLDKSITDSATGQSFPSGHTQNSSVTYTSVALFFRKKHIWITAIILICLIGLSRIILGVHYPTDVIAGAILGIGSAFVGTYLHIKFENDKKKLLTMYLIVAFIFLPFLLIFFNKVVDDYISIKDFYTIYAFYIGYIIAVFIDFSFINFNCNNPLKIRILRTIIALVIVVAIQFGLKIVFPKDNLYFDMIRYFLLSFVGLGIYPLLTKKWLFSKRVKYDVLK